MRVGVGSVRCSLKLGADKGERGWFGSGLSIGRLIHPWCKPGMCITSVITYEVELECVAYLNQGWIQPRNVEGL